MTAPTLAQLLPAARSGDTVAMEQLLRLTRPDIRRYALRHCAATTATDDVVQEALLLTRGADNAAARALLSYLRDVSYYLDAALALAALSFVATLAAARSDRGGGPFR